MNVFKDQNHVWLCSELHFVVDSSSKSPVVQKENPTVFGRPRLPFSEKSEFSKRKEAADLSTEKADTYLLVRAAATSARKQSDADLAAVLKKEYEKPNKTIKNAENY